MCQVLAQRLLEDRPHDGPYAAVVIFLLGNWQGLPSGRRGVHLPARHDCHQKMKKGKNVENGWNGCHH